VSRLPGDQIAASLKGLRTLTDMSFMDSGAHTHA
jgi:hypothetical protein